jgi:hypothetical protein
LHFKNPTDKENKVARFAHYTSAEAALNIIRSKRIWMRNATCMTDYLEVQHGFQIYRNYFSKKENESAFIQALDRCSPGAAKEAINLFNQWWADIQFHTYITSLSEHDDKEDFHGRLSMWRAFGGNPGRVALILGLPWFADAGFALHVSVSPVAYSEEAEVHAVIGEVIQNIYAEREFLASLDRATVVGMAFHFLVAGVTCTKHAGFREEREWRGIYSPNRWPSPLIESSIEVIGGVPQIIHKIPLDAAVLPALAELDFARLLDRVIIGPSPYPLVMKQAFVAALTAAGVKDPDQRVVISNIPIRG